MAVALAMQCPYWRWHRREVSVCEGCRLTFASKEEEREFFLRYCASENGWRGCSVARNLELSYERGLRR